MPLRRLLALVAIVVVVLAFLAIGIAAALFAGRLLTPHPATPTPLPSPSPSATAGVTPGATTIPR